MKPIYYSTAALLMFAISPYALWPERASLESPTAAGEGFAEQDESTAPEIRGSLNQHINRLNSHIEKQLSSIVDLHFDDEPWEDVRDYLVDKFKFNIFTDQSVEDVLTDDEPISLSVKSIPLEIALSQILRRFHATFVVKNGILTIISSDYASDPEQLNTKIFDCRALMQALDLSRSSIEFPAIGAPITRWPAVGSQQMPAGGMGGMGGMGGGMFRLGLVEEKSNLQQGEDSSNTATEGATHTLFPATKFITRKDQLLLEVVKTFVDPNSWNDNSGHAEAKIVNGFLIVAHTREGLREVETLVELLKSEILGNPVR